MSAAEVARPGVGFGRFLGSELRLVFGRRRNQMGLLVLAGVPVVMAIALRASSRAGGPMGGLLSGNGLIVAVMALIAEAPFFLPLAISMLAGDAIAGEANQGTLRYLLTVPVGRTRLLVVKFCSLLVGCLTGVAVVAVVGIVSGAALLGAGPAWTMSGTQIGFWAGVGRIALMYLYYAALLAALAAIGLLISVLTDQPLAATVAIMIVNILSWIALAVEQLAWLHPWLLSNWMLSFTELLSDPMMTTNVVKGLQLAAGYVVVFGLAAWARFTHKDITS